MQYPVRSLLNDHYNLLPAFCDLFSKFPFMDCFPVSGLFCFVLPSPAPGLCLLLFCFQFFRDLRKFFIVQNIFLLKC